jgi:hypothetical protein
VQALAKPRIKPVTTDKEVTPSSLMAAFEKMQSANKAIRQLFDSAQVKAARAIFLRNAFIRIFKYHIPVIRVET